MLALVIERLAGLHLGVRTGLAIVFGVLTGLGFAPLAWWPLLLPGIAGFSLLVLGAGRLRQALLLGWGYGLGYMGVGLNWMRAIFVEAMLGIVLVTSLLYVLLAALSWAMRRLALWPLGFAAAWVAVEALISRWPFGGFGWMRLGYAMTDSPLAGLYPVVGVAGVSFVVALLAQGLAWLLVSWNRRHGLIAAAVLAAIALLTATGAAIPPGTPVGQTTTIGWVQGGAPGGGVYGIGPPRATTERHLAETLALFEAVADGTQPRPDFVVWPENGTDLDPYHDAQTAALLQQALEAAGVPILVGTILDGPGPEERQTASLWLDPQAGELERYVKRGIVPFGEFVPYRDVLLPLFPILRYVGAQSIAGTEPGVITARVGEGFPLGVMVCYDVSFDDIAYDTVQAGGEVLVVQSSNAMYQGTGQIEQQFAITRARAAELRREILVVTTSGVSGLIRPDGSIEFQVSDPGPASGVVELERRTGVTPAVSVAPALELVLVLVTLALVVAGALPASRRKSPAWAEMAQ